MTPSNAVASSTLLLPLLLLLLLQLPLQAQSVTAEATCTDIPPTGRVDCWPETLGATEAACRGRGCCWRDSTEDTVNASGQDAEPFCYYPTDYPAYRLVAAGKGPAGEPVLTFRKDAGPGTPWPGDQQQVTLSVTAHSARVARIRIADRPDTKRWQVPLPLFGGGGSAEPEFNVSVPSKAGEKFFVRISRRADAWPLFDTSATFGPLVFADQFIQLSTGLRADVAYGVGEHLGPFAKQLNQWKRLVLWSHDAEPTPDENLYGAHNFLLAVSSGGRAFGIFLLNSNAQEVTLQPRLGQTATATYRTIGGILDFFVFTGPTPKDVITQYHELIGPPMMPPLWSVGYHLCRYGFPNLTRLQYIYERNVRIDIPIDVMWADIDYMDDLKDWTVDPVRFGGLGQFIDQMHSQHRSFVVIVDPGIKNNAPGYPAYDLGLSMGVFMRSADNKTYIVGKVWPGDVLWPDFSHPNASDYWHLSAKDFLASQPVDGLWMDMNEPSNVYQGSKTGCPPGNQLDYPPYVPRILGYNILFRDTVCPSALQYLSSHYNLHNMYAYYEAMATWQLLRTRPDGKVDKMKRQFVLSRSTFPGIQRYAFHWTGDNDADWYNLHYSVSSILSFNLYGIVNTGTDVCGFNTATTEELCIRWTQLAAFYPFMRNHNSLGLPDQDPAAFSKPAQDIFRFHIKLRYYFLPYIYTQFYHASTNSSTVARSLMEEFPSDEATWLVDDQFLFGPGLMVCPVVSEGATDRQVYFPPEARWFDLTSPGKAEVPAKGLRTVPAPLSYIPLYARGGHILPVQMPGNDTHHQKLLNPFALLVALDARQSAEGSLFWDKNGVDDLSLGTFQLLQLSAAGGSLRSRVVHQYDIGVQMKLLSIDVYGLTAKPSGVVVNGRQSQFTYNATTGLLQITGLAGVDLRVPLSASWQ